MTTAKIIATAAKIIKSKNQFQTSITLSQTHITARGEGFIVKINHPTETEGTFITQKASEEKTDTIKQLTDALKAGDTIRQETPETVIVNGARIPLTNPDNIIPPFAINATYDPPTITTLHYSDFIDTLTQLEYARAVDDCRYYLNGMLFKTDTKNNTITLAATDGHRCARKITRLTETYNSQTRELIIPNPVINAFVQLAKIIKPTLNQHIRFSSLNDGLIEARTPQITLTFKPIEGRYPDLERIYNIPSSEETEQISLCPRALLAALKPLKTAGRGSTKPLELFFEGTQLTLRNSSGVTQTMQVYRKHETTKGIGCNLAYMIDLADSLTLSTYKGDKITLTLNKCSFDRSADVIYATDNKHSKIEHLLMPLRTR